MTLEAIKREISARLREVRSDAAELSTAENYPDLQRLITKTLSRVALCESSADFDAIDDLLAAIEDCWNGCKAELQDGDSDDTLFEFNFELDSDDDATDDAESLEAPPDPDDDEADGSEDAADDETDDATDDDTDGETGDDKEIAVDGEALDISAELDEIEKLYSQYDGKGNLLHHIKLKSLRKNAITAVRAAGDKAALVTETHSYRRNFGNFAKSIEKFNSYLSAKKTFDDTHSADGLNMPGIIRLVVGGIALLSGIGYGLIDAKFWPWNGWAWAVIGAGLSYLLLGLVYVAAARRSYSIKIVRQLAFSRLIIAALAVVASLIIGLALDVFGPACAFTATIPLTLCGVLNYFYYRIRLASIVSKQKRKK